MKVLYALICEHAHDRQDGRLDVHGVFHQLYAPCFPAEHQFTVAIAIEWEPHEAGTIDLSIDLMDPANSPVLSIKGQTEVGARQPMQGPPLTRLVMPLERVVFPLEGSYMFELVLGDERVRLAPLHLIRDGGAN